MDCSARAKDILIVEDDRAQARLLALIAEREGYAVRCVYDGDAALAEVARATPRAVVLDLLLPGTNGEAVLARLQADPATRVIPVIAISAFYRGRETSERLGRAGAAAFLHKPFHSDALVAELRRLIGDDDDDDTCTRIELARVPVPELIWGAVEREFSGAIHFARGEYRKSLVFERGQPAAIRSNLKGETLGERLVARGLIDRASADASLQRERSAGELQGETLVKMGKIRREALEEELRLQAAAKVLELFTWSEGQAWEEPGVRALAMSTPLAGWSAEHLITRGATLMNPKWVGSLLAPYREHQIALDGDATLSGVPDPLRRQLERGMRVGSVEPSDASAVYAAWRVGKLRFAAADGAAPVDGASAALARKLEALAALKQQQDLYQVLELEPGADASQVERAWERLAAQFAPERFAKQQPRVISLAARIRARVDLARTLLGDPLTAQAYARRVEAWDMEEEERGNLTQQACAEAEVLRAHTLLARRDVRAARAALERALSASPDDAETLALHAWTCFLEGRGQPEAEREALERALKARALAPDAAEPTYYLALIWRHQGQTDLAARALRRVLQLQPGHRAAERELRLLSLRGPARAP